MLASMKVSDRPTLELLINNGTDINAKNNDGDTILLIAEDKERIYQRLDC